MRLQLVGVDLVLLHCQLETERRQWRRGTRLRDLVSEPSSTATAARWIIVMVLTSGVRPIPTVAPSAFELLFVYKPPCPLHPLELPMFVLSIELIGLIDSPDNHPEWQAWPIPAGEQTIVRRREAA